MSIDRRNTILKCIVEYFIKTAQPLGSKTLLEEYHLPYSSATIRNEMFALEQMGLIEKTHLSSGRVPSSKGYRYYCEHLREKSVSEELKQSLQQVLQNKTKSIEETIKASCEILSHMTSLVSVVLGPNEHEEKLANVQLVRIGDNIVTSVFVTDKGYVENKTFIVPENIKVDEVISCVKLLNDRLVGTPISELVDKMKALKPIISDYIVDHDIVYQTIMGAFLKFASDRLSLYGQDELFKHPEFTTDSEKLKKVLNLLSNSSAFKEIESNNDDSEGLKINIGDIDDNPEVSMVSAKVKIGEDENTIALVGPTRMDYEKALSALEYLVNELNKYFDERK